MEGRMTRLLVSREILRVSVGESGSIFQTAPKPLPDRSGSGSGAVWERFGNIRFGRPSLSEGHHRMCNVESTCMRRRRCFESIVKRYFQSRFITFLTLTIFEVFQICYTARIWRDTIFANFFHDGFAIPDVRVCRNRVVMYPKHPESSRGFLGKDFLVSRNCLRNRSQTAPEPLPERLGSGLGAIRESSVQSVPVIAAEVLFLTKSSFCPTKCLTFLNSSQKYFQSSIRAELTLIWNYIQFVERICLRIVFESLRWLLKGVGGDIVRTKIVAVLQILDQISRRKTDTKSIV